MSRATEERQGKKDRYSTSVFYSSPSPSPGQVRRGYQRPQPKAVASMPASGVQRKEMSGTVSAVAGFSVQVQGERNGSSQSARPIVLTQPVSAPLRNTGERGEKVYPVSLLNTLDALLNP